MDPMPREGVSSGPIEKLGHQSRPAGLMAGTEPGAMVSMKVFVKEDEIVPGRVDLELFALSEEGSSA